LARFSRYEWLGLPGAVLNGIVTFVVARLGLPLLAAAAVGVLTAALWNFVLNVPSIWRIWGKGPRREPDDTA
jgi:putative flippase GtrA